MCPTALVLASSYEGEDDDFVLICTNRAVLDVGLLSLHDLRADSLIRPTASRSVIQLSNHNIIAILIIIFFLHIYFT